MQFDASVIVQAIVAIISGATGVKVMDYLGRRQQFRHESDASAVDDWREEAQTLRKENRELNSRLDGLVGAHADCKAETQILRAQVALLQARVSELEAVQRHDTN